MKKTVTLLSAVFATLQIFAQTGSVKPTVVSTTPAFDEHFKTTSVNKISKSKNVVVGQFNLNIAEEEYIDVRSGGTKKTMDDAMINLQFKIVNLDKQMVQNTTNELHNYLLEKLKSSGFNIVSYDKFKGSEHFEKLSKSDPLNGNTTNDIKPEGRPGFLLDLSRNKFIGFSANNMSSFDMMGMKSMKLGKITKELDADVLGFGVSVHFIEWASIEKMKKISVEHKPQLFFEGANIQMSIYPGYVALVDEKPFGYSFGKEFVKEIKDSGNNSVINNATYKLMEVTVDNDKLKEALLELGKSYIDNMVSGLVKK